MAGEMIMLRVVIILLVLYLVVILLSLISEITYKKRHPKDVLKDFKKIVINVSIYFIIFLVASIIYFNLNKK